ncbi:MAG TPA: BtpA/SgcQ family protein [Candidatus Galloscillospira excrementavium]|nr:BtpA/SgcQ family protein [Candidatus Galloscillospira excrementavium]
MTTVQKIFGDKKPIIGMVHLKPLPGSPGYGGDLEAVYRAALADLEALKQGGVDAAIVENFGDIPYGTTNELITYTAFTHLATRLREQCAFPLGLNVQFNDYQAEWAIAYACAFDFIRVECFAENRMGPNGFCPPCGPELMRLKGRYPREIALLADVHVKHTFPLVEQPLDFTVESILEGGADALICTGITTGKSPSVDDVREMKRLAGDVPVIVGSGVNDKTVREYLAVSDGAIIGSSFKRDGKVLNPVDPARVERLMAQLR